MDLNFSDVIVRPRVTGKAYTLNQKSKKLVLEVHPCATKSLIARALKSLFSADAQKINIVSVPAKRRRVGTRVVEGKRKKKAIITLKGGSMENLMSLMSSQGHGGMIEPYKAE